MELMTRDFYVLVEWIFVVREEGLDQIQPQHADVAARFDIEIGDVAPAIDIARGGEFMIRRDPNKNWRITLLVAVTNSFVDLSIERRDTDNRRRFAANRVGIRERQFFAMNLF